MIIRGRGCLQDIFHKRIKAHLFQLHQVHAPVRSYLSTYVLKVSFFSTIDGDIVLIV